MQGPTFPVRSRLWMLSICIETTFVDIANYINDNPTSLALDLQGIWITDRK